MWVKASLFKAVEQWHCDLSNSFNQIEKAKNQKKTIISAVMANPGSEPLTKTAVWGQVKIPFGQGGSGRLNELNFDESDKIWDIKTLAKNLRTNYKLNQIIRVHFQVSLIDCKVISVLRESYWNLHAADDEQVAPLPEVAFSPESPGFGFVFYCIRHLSLISTLLRVPPNCFITSVHIWLSVKLADLLQRIGS
jgi:hypothetical protein